MFKKANLKLTLTYSLLFLCSFWIFSIGAYVWMEKSFDEDYVSEIREHEREDENEDEEFGERESDIIEIAGSVSLANLRNILLVLNGGLLIIVPVVAWFITRRTLTPVQQIHEQQKQFVSDVAHELRTPLSIMTGEMEVTLSHDRSIPEYKQTIRSSKEEADHLVDLVENLLFLARSDQGRQAITFEKVDITDVIGSIIASLQTEVAHKKIALHFEPEDEPTFVSGQPSLLRRLFFNLIHNAILYTPEGGNIWVSLSADKQYTQIRVKDTGVGISLENQKKVFDRFYRIDSSRSEHEGYGLGLAISKSIVELLHGKITLHSVPGQGTTFTVLFPRVSD